MIRLIALSFVLLVIESSHAQPNHSEDEDVIRASRKASNAALLLHNVDDVAAYWLDEFIVTAGNGSVKVGKDSAYASLKRSLDQTPGLTYIRTPKKIVISDADTLAFETGKWIGLKTKEKTPNWVGGNYSAMWWKRNGVWKLRSELFVTLKHY